MRIWDGKRYAQEKRTFIQQRIHQAPLWTQFTLIFGTSWGAAWFCSWFLLRFIADTQPWVKSLPIRYSLAFLLAYACFFMAVRAWIEIAKREPEQQSDCLESADVGIGAIDGEGGLIVTALLSVGFIAGGVFLFVGGAPMLLEAAFEAAFAGIIVRRPLAGDLTLGDWKSHLLKNTWKQSLLAIVLLVVFAAWLQQHVPQAVTFADALRDLWSRPYEEAWDGADNPLWRFACIACSAC